MGTRVVPAVQKVERRLQPKASQGLSQRSAVGKNDLSHQRRGWSRGQVLLLTGVAMVALIGCVAVATDVGLLWTERRQMQTAADAAAIAAATALRNSESISSAADNVASLNNFTNGTNGATVTVNNPPLAGLYVGNSNYVEVVIAQPEPTYFLRVFGYNSMNISTRAVSGAVNGPACIYALDHSASDAIDLNGNITINASCGIMDNSNSSSGLYASGNGTITATSMGVVGNYSASGNMKLSPNPSTGMAPAPDPLANLAAPTVGTCTDAAPTNTGSESFTGNISSQTIQPAVYSGGISVSGNVTTLTFAAGTFGNQINFNGNGGNLTFNPGQYQNGSGSSASIVIAGNTTVSFASGTYSFCGPVQITGNNTVTLQPGLYYGGIAISGNANVTFSPGTYVLAGGGLSVIGNSTISGSGVTFYDTTGLGGYGPIAITGNGLATLSAPTSGPLEGILFFQDRSIASGSAASSFTGNVSDTFDGALYFPTTSISYVGNSSGSGYTFLIADKVTVTGNASMTIGDNYSSLANGSPIKSDALYE